MVLVSATQDDVRSRILDAAEAIFARKGYAGASIRELTQEAACNIASIHYHFRSKEGLYVSMFERLLEEMREQRIAAVNAVLPQASRSGELEPVIRAFAMAFLKPLRDPKRGTALMQLFTREMAHPHLPPNMVMERMIYPIQQTMREALRSCCEGLRADQAILCMHSLVGQLIHVVQSWTIFTRADRTDAPILDIDRTVDHIVRFTVAGIRACQHAGDGEAPGPG